MLRIVSADVYVHIFTRVFFLAVGSSMCLAGSRFDMCSSLCLHFVHSAHFLVYFHFAHFSFGVLCEAEQIDSFVKRKFLGFEQPPPSTIIIQPQRQGM